MGHVSGDIASTITPEQGAHLLGIGFSDYLEGLELLEQQREHAELEHRFPGINLVFDRLIRLLPEAQSINTTEFPVAASVIKAVEGEEVEVIATAVNSTNRLNNSNAHAERHALDEAMDKVGKHLDGHVLVSTAQGCVGCSGCTVDSRVDGVIYGVPHDDLRGKYARVKGVYKPWRTIPEHMDMDEYLRESGMFVVRGFRKSEIQARLERTHGNWASYYRDPDA